MLNCGSGCIDVATNAQNCRKCGHDCGYGATCVSGVCTSVTLNLASTVVTEYEVDDQRIVFTPSGIRSCSAAGCLLTPDTVTTYPPGCDRFMANGYVFVQYPDASVKHLYPAYKLCPATGCIDSAPTNTINIVTTNQQVGFGTATASQSNFYFTESIPVSNGKGLAVCGAPASTACTQTGGLFGLDASELLASDTTVYFRAVITGTTSAFYSCPAASLTSCTPTAVSYPPDIAGTAKPLAAYADQIYFWRNGQQPPHTAPEILGCPPNGCQSPGRFTVLAIVSGTVTEIEVDSSGAYWILGNQIQTCPLTGCVGGPVTLATASATPERLRLNTQFVYWLQATDGSVHRVAKPAK